MTHNGGWTPFQKPANIHRKPLGNKLQILAIPNGPMKFLVASGLAPGPPVFQKRPGAVLLFFLAVSRRGLGILE